MNPTVSVIMLCSPGRDQMRLRAVRSIEAQTYQPIQFITHESRPGVTIGQLRNEACARAFGDIIVTQDDDDVSHGRRVEEQVALLVASGADAVGYRECLFWDSRKAQIEVHPELPGPDGSGCLGIVKSVGEAWLYRSPDTQYAIGASLAFWRKTWQRVPFDPKLPDGRASEDWRFVKSVKTIGASGTSHDFMNPESHERRWCRICGTDSIDQSVHCEPRLICGIHGANSANYDKFSAHTWKRAPAWDEYARERMAL